MKQADLTPTLAVEMQTPETLLIKLSGNTGGDNDPLDIGLVRDALDKAARVRLLSFESAGVTVWDSRFVAFVRKCADLCRKRNVELQGDGLPEGVRRLLRLGVMSEWQRDWAPEGAVEAVAEISLAHGG